VMVEPVDSEIAHERQAFGLPSGGGRPATTTERIKKEGDEAGLQLLRVETFLPLDYLFVLRAK